MNYETTPQPQLPATENTGKEIWKVLKIQLGIFAVYQIGLAVICKIGNTDGFIILDMFPLFIHWLILVIMMIICFANSKKGKGLGYLISLLVTGIVGFGSCFLIADLIGSNFSVH